MESVAKIHGLVSEESKHVPSERIVVGGFSQGAALSLLVSLTTEKKVCPLSASNGSFHATVLLTVYHHTDCWCGQLVRLPAAQSESQGGAFVVRIFHGYSL